MPVATDLAHDLGKHDFLSEKCILDILMVIFFKQDVLPVELAALSALQSLAEFAHVKGSAENRLLAIQVLQMTVSRLGKDSMSRAVP